MASAMSSDHELMRQVALGLDVQAFLATTAGQQLVARCDDLIESARAQLEDVDPEDPKAVRRLQNEAAIGHAIKRWLEEFAMSGEQAEQQIAAQQSPD
jgi:exonuclease VII small subunit